VIIGYTGPLGSGKTLGAVMDAYKYSLQANGAPIYANIELYPAMFEPHRQRNPHFKLGRIRTTEDILRAVVEGGGLLLFDEMHQNVDARLSTMMANILLSQFLMFLRKMGLTCLYTTQDESQIDKRMRKVTDVLVWCQGYGPKNGRTHTYTKWHYLSGRNLGIVTATPDTARIYHSAYNTYEFTRRLEFPSNLKAFDRFMIELEGAAEFARSYDGERDRAWATFVSQSRDTAGEATPGGQKVPSKSHVRKGAGRTPGGRRGPKAGGGTELEAEANLGG
jgi:hypothetical protein